MTSTLDTAVAIRPFHVDIPDEALEDLRRRIRPRTGRRRRPSRTTPRVCPST